MADKKRGLGRGLSALIGDVDIEAFFTDVGLDKHLSPNRRNDFFSIVEKIKSYAAGN